MELTVTEWEDIEFEVGSKINWMFFPYLFVKGCPIKVPWAIPWMCLVGARLARQSCLCGWIVCFSCLVSSEAGTWGRWAFGWIRCDCSSAEHLVQAEETWRGKKKDTEQNYGELARWERVLRKLQRNGTVEERKACWTDRYYETHFLLALEDDVEPSPFFLV